MIRSILIINLASGAPSEFTLTTKPKQIIISKRVYDSARCLGSNVIQTIIMNMNNFDFEKIDNLDKAKALALTSILLSAEKKSKLPKNFRLTGNFIIVISAVSFVFSFAEFYRRTAIYVMMLLLGNTIMITCAIGFRHAKKWSLYIFLCLYLVCLFVFLHSAYQSGSIAMDRFILRNIVPFCFILTALFNWKYFK